MASKVIIQAVAVTAELLGTTLSPEAATVFCNDLDGYGERVVLDALTRCRREVKGRLTLADVISRIDDGRPGPEEAWAKIPLDEAVTVCWTDEISEAFGIAYPLIAEGDMIAARMAFREAYNARVSAARAEGRSVNWQVSLGHDRAGRESVIEQAVAQGKLTREFAEKLLPHDSTIVSQPGQNVIAGAIATTEKAATDAGQQGSQKIHKHLEKILLLIRRET